MSRLYCHDIHERLVLYKRMANCSNDEQLDDMQRESVDRFGLLPNPPIDPLKIIQLIQSSREYSLSGPDRLKILVKIEDVNKRVMRIRELIQKLSTNN